MAKTIWRMLLQAALGASAAALVQVMSVYERQRTWFPDECFVGHPRPWLAGVGSSLEMRVALEPLIANGLDGSGCFLFALALLGAAIPTRVELRGLLVGVALVFAALLVPVAMTINYWQWSVEPGSATCAPMTRTAW